jgi:hypothetical protein
LHEKASAGIIIAIHMSLGDISLHYSLRKDSTKNGVKKSEFFFKKLWQF